MAGEWTTWKFDDLEHYSKVVQGFFGVGCSWEVLAYATQLVNGTNYTFLVKKTIMSPPFLPDLVKVHAHLDLQGKWTHKEPEKVIP